MKDNNTMLIHVAFVSAFLLIGSLAQDKDGASIKQGPSNTKGAKDHDATMYCQVENKGKNNLYWHCNSANGEQDVTVGPDVNTNPALNTKYIIDNKGASVGQYNLIITNVTSLDSGTCSCIVETGKGNAMEEGAILEVMDTTNPPLGGPECTIDKISTPGQPRRIFTADDDITLQCTSVGGIPLADLHWEIVRAGSAGKGVEIVSSIMTKAGSGSSQDSITAVANYKITAADNGAYFQCIQNHAMLERPGRCSPIYTNMNGMNRQVGSPANPIEVKYLPVLRFTPSALTVTPTEQLTEIIKCEADSNPELDSGPTITFKPRTRDETVNWNYTTEGREDEITVTIGQSDVGKVFECLAANELGHSVKEIKIESSGLLPTWILVIIIGGSGLILFIIMLVVCCICFCDNDEEKDSHSMNRSRPGTYQDSELGVDDEFGYQSEVAYQDGGYDPDMVNINEFGGGMEMSGNNYETGEDNTGYIDDELLDEDDDDGAVPPAPPIELKSTPSSRTYDEVPM